MTHKTKTKWKVLPTNLIRNIQIQVIYVEKNKLNC